METLGARKWSVVAKDRFEDEGDPFYPINDEQYDTEKEAEEAAGKYLSDKARKRFSGGEDSLFIVSPIGKKRLFKK